MVDLVNMKSTGPVAAAILLILFFVQAESVNATSESTTLDVRTSATNYSVTKSESIRNGAEDASEENDLNFDEGSGDVEDSGNTDMGVAIPDIDEPVTSKASVNSDTTPGVSDTATDKQVNHTTVKRDENWTASIKKMNLTTVEKDENWTATGKQMNHTTVERDEDWTVIKMAVIASGVCVVILIGNCLQLTVMAHIFGRRDKEAEAPMKTTVPKVIVTKDPDDLMEVSVVELDVDSDDVAKGTAGTFKPNIDSGKDADEDLGKKEVTFQNDAKTEEVVPKADDPAKMSANSITDAAQQDNSVKGEKSSPGEGKCAETDENRKLGDKTDENEKLAESKAGDAKAPATTDDEWPAPPKDCGNLELDLMNVANPKDTTTSNAADETLEKIEKYVAAMVADANEGNGAKSSPGVIKDLDEQDKGVDEPRETSIEIITEVTSL